MTEQRAHAIAIMLTWLATVGVFAALVVSARCSHQPTPVVGWWEAY